MWHYKDASTELIRKVINGFHWERTSLNVYVEEKFVFNEIILDIFANFIFHETLIFDGKDPPWFTNNDPPWFTNKNCF